MSSLQFRSKISVLTQKASLPFIGSSPKSVHTAGGYYRQLSGKLPNNKPWCNPMCALFAICFVGGGGLGGGGGGEGGGRRRKRRIYLFKWLLFLSFLFGMIFGFVAAWSRFECVYVISSVRNLRFVCCDSAVLVVLEIYVVFVVTVLYQ